MSCDLTDLPCIVRQAEELAELAARINAEHGAGESATRKGLEHFRAAGDGLLKAREQCGPRKFKPWLEKHVKFGRTTAYSYMRLAENWSICSAAEHMRDALRLLTDDTPDEDDDEEGAPQAPPGEKPFDVPEESERLRKWLESSRDRWPEQVRDEFAGFVRRQVSAFESGLDVDRELAGPGPHVAHATGEEEWYTPAEHLDAARLALGAIDLDPASCDLAQQAVRAVAYFTKADDGLTKPWAGRVWLNPPYRNVRPFADKLATHYRAGEVTAAIALVNNCTDTLWFKPLAETAAALCFPVGRVKFTDAHGNTDRGSPLQGQVFVYLGDDADGFRAAFEGFGTVWVPFRN